MSQVTISDTVNWVASAYAEIGPFWDKKLNYRGPRIIAVAGNPEHLWSEQHGIKTRTKRNHSRTNSGRLTIGGNYSRSPLAISHTSGQASRAFPKFESYAAMEAAAFCSL